MSTTDSKYNTSFSMNTDKTDYTISVFEKDSNGSESFVDKRNYYGDFEDTMNYAKNLMHRLSNSPSYALLFNQKNNEQHKINEDGSYDLVASKKIVDGYEVINLGGDRYDGGLIYEIKKDGDTIHRGIIDGEEMIEFGGKSYDGLRKLAESLGAELKVNQSMASGGKMEFGGMLLHGFYEGDTILKIYKGYGIVENKNNGVIEVLNPNKGTRFIIDLDDSKSSGMRKSMGMSKAEQIESAKEYIDYLNENLPDTLDEKLQYHAEGEMASGGMMADGGESNGYNFGKSGTGFDNKKYDNFSKSSYDSRGLMLKSTDDIKTLGGKLVIRKKYDGKYYWEYLLANGSIYKKSNSTYNTKQEAINNYLKQSFNKGGMMADGGELDKLLKEQQELEFQITDIKLGSDLNTEEGVNKYRKLISPIKDKLRSIDKQLDKLGYEPFASGGMMAKGGMVVTSIKDIPNFKERLKEGKITYRGMGMGKKSDNFYDLAGEHGVSIKVDGKEYHITRTEFDTFSRGADGKLRIKFAAPYRRSFADGGELDWQNAERGDSALVKSENKMGYIIKAYGRKFHLKFVDGTEKTYDATELKFIKDEDGYLADGGMMASGGEIADIEKIKKSLTAKAKAKGIYENFGQKELRQLEDKYGYTAEVQKFDNWAMNFDLSQLADGGMMEKGAEINMNKVIWRNLTVGDFIRRLEREDFPFEPKFKSREEVKKWAMEDQIYYKGYIPEVVDYFWKKNDEKYSDSSIELIPMDLQRDLVNTAHWGGTDIRGVIGILNAMIDSDITDEDLEPIPAKSSSAIEKAREKKIKEIWAKIEPKYKGDFKGNQYYSTISRLVSIAEEDKILKRYKPFRKYQKDYFADGGMMAKGGSTKNRKSIRDLTLEQISSSTNIGEGGIRRFADENNLTDSELSNIMQGIGRGMISKLDFATAISGNKDNSYSKEIVDFAKSGKAYRLADGGKTTVVEEFGSTNFRNQYDDWEMVVISKGLEKDGAQYLTDRYLVSARDIEEAKKIVTELWEKGMSNSDFHIVKVMSDSLYRLKYMDVYADGGMMAKGGEIAEYRVTPSKRGQGSLSNFVEADYKMAFTIKGSKQEAEKAAQSFVTENNETHPSATVTKIHPSGQPLKNKKVSYVTRDEITKFADGGYMADGGVLNRDLNIKVRNLATNEMFTPNKLGREYEEAMAKAVVVALIDANFNSEARKLVSILEKNPKIAEKPNYPNPSDPNFKEKMADIEKEYGSDYFDADEKTTDFGLKVSRLAGYDGLDIANAFIYTLKMNGSHRLADKIKNAM
jgi:hypothetical protein